MKKQSRTLEALEREEVRREREQLPEGLQQAIKRTQDAIEKAVAAGVKKGTKIKMTFVA